MQVTQAPGRKFSMTPYFSVIIGVTISILLCILLSFIKRCLRNRRLRYVPATCQQLRWLQQRWSFWVPLKRSTQRCAIC